jgi:hypothetical protein
MPKPKIATRTDQLRQLASSQNAEAFVERLRPLLLDDFSRWFAELKVQKLIGQFRSQAHIETIRDLLLRPEGKKTPLQRDEAEAVGHHLDVCSFFQDLYDYIDAETAPLSCRVAHPELFVRTIVRVIETVNYGFHRNTTAAVLAEGGATALQISHNARQFRDLLDAGNTILNSEIAKKGVDREYKISNADINRLFELAYEYDEVRQLFDIYTYQGASFRINRRSLIIKKNSRETDIAAAVAAERTANYDQIRFAMLTVVEAKVQEECRRIAVESSHNFFDFLLKLDQSARDASREHYYMLRADFEYELADYFDLDSLVETKAGQFSVRELVSAWAFIFALATLGQRWSERLAVVKEQDSPKASAEGGRRLTVVDVPTPELGRNWFVRLLRKEANVSRKQAEALVEQFSSEIGIGRTDLFYKPLIPIPDMVLLPTAYVRSSRFDRNIFMLIATESDLDQKKKGYLPVRNLRKDFINAGFQAVTDFTIRIDGQEVTDLDLAAFKDGTLFLAQSKIVIEPDSLYDIWKAEEKLSRAAAQLDKCLQHLEVVREGLFEQLGIRGTHEKRVVPFIVTNSRQFTERRFGGYPVVDVPYVEFLLGGARGAVVGTAPGKLRTGSGKKYIKGSRPTAEEFEELLKRTIHRVMERETVERYGMKKIGDRKIHVPMMGLKTSGEGRMILTDRETFEKDYG